MKVRLVLGAWVVCIVLFAVGESVGGLTGAVLRYASMVIVAIVTMLRIESRRSRERESRDNSNDGGHGS